MDIFEEDQQEIIFFGKLLWKYRRKLSIFALTGMVLGIFLATLTPSQYVSTGIIYPTKFRDTLTLIHNSRLGIELYSDRIVQLLRSDTALDLLEKTTEIPPEAEFSVQRTALLSIEIKAATYTPESSARLVNTLIGLTDSLRMIVFREEWPLEGIYIVQDGKAAEKPESAVWWFYGILGLILGFIAGILAFTFINSQKIS